MHQTININNLNEYKGQILVRETKTYKWMFILVGISNPNPFRTRMVTTQGIDLFPQARFYMNNMYCDYYNKTNSFFNITTEFIPKRAEDGIIRLPTKNELVLLYCCWF